MTNVWNRLNIATKQVAGEWARSDEARDWKRKQVAADLRCAESRAVIAGE